MHRSREPGEQGERTVQRVHPFIEQTRGNLRIITPTTLLFNVRCQPSQCTKRRPQALYATIKTNHESTTSKQGSLPQDQSRNQYQRVMLRSQDVKVQRHVLSPRHQYGHVPTRGAVPREYKLLFSTTTQNHPRREPPITTRSKCIQIFQFTRLYPQKASHQGSHHALQRAIQTYGGSTTKGHHLSHGLTTETRERAQVPFQRPCQHRRNHRSSHQPYKKGRHWARQGDDVGEVVANKNIHPRCPRGVGSCRRVVQTATTLS